MVAIENRLCQLLIEREFAPKLKPRSTPEAQDWEIVFYDNDMDIHVIHSTTPVAKLWWLEESIGEAAPKTPFDAWLQDLDRLFMAEYGLSHDDFDDYDWHSEFDSKIPPKEAFDEWQLLNEGSTLGG